MSAAMVRASSPSMGAVGREHRAKHAHRERAEALHALHVLVARLATKRASGGRARRSRASPSRRAPRIIGSHDGGQIGRHRARHLDVPARTPRSCECAAALARPRRRPGPAAEDALERVLRVAHAAGEARRWRLRRASREAIERRGRERRIGSGQRVRRVGEGGALRHGGATVAHPPKSCLRGRSRASLGRMRRGSSTYAAFALLGLVPLPMVACLQQVSTGTGTTDPAATATATAAATGTATPTGAECGTNPATGVTLCEQIDLCPSITVDQGAFAQCGFRIHPGAVIHLECLCGDSLCPIGVPDTCDEATQLLSSAQSALVVCEEASSGRCVAVSAGASTTPTSTATAAPTSTAVPSTCDKDCQSQCAGNPDCYQLCGC